LTADRPVAVGTDRLGIDRPGAQHECDEAHLAQVDGAMPLREAAALMTYPLATPSATSAPRRSASRAL